MVKYLLCLPLFLGLALSVMILSQSSRAAGQDGDRIAQLVQQLGSSKYAEREKAKIALEAIGLPALDQLRKATKDGDLETRRRCEELVKKLEDKLAADTLLAPKKVKLNFKDTPVMKAIEELQKQSGYTIVVEGDRVPLAKRKVTLETGEVTFWEAFDKLCESANLSEVHTNNAVVGQAIYIDGNEVIIIRQGVPMQPAPAVQPVPQVMPLPANGGVQPAPVQKAPPKVDKVLPPTPGKESAEAFQASPQHSAALQVQVPAVGGNGQAAAGKALPPVQVAPAPPVQPAPAGQIGGPVQIKPGVIQVPGKPAQIQILPASQPRKTPATGNYQSGTIVVRDGLPEKFPTSYYRSLRIRLLPANRATEIAVQPAKKGETLFLIDVTPEPRLQQFSINGTPRIDKALDDLGQELTIALEPMPDSAGPTGAIARSTYIQYTNPQPRQVALRLKLGQKSAKTLKELAGSLSVQALSAIPKAIITVNDVTKAEGKTAKGTSGGLIEVLKFEKLNNGTYRVKFRYEQPPQFFPANNGAPVPVGAAVVEVQARLAIANAAGVRSTASTISQGLPALVDAKGKTLNVEQTQRRNTANNGVVTQEITMVVRAATGVGEPTQLVLTGHTMVTAQVPFRFEGVKLP